MSFFSGKGADEDCAWLYFHKDTNDKDPKRGHFFDPKKDNVPRNFIDKSHHGRFGGHGIEEYNDKVSKYTLKTQN